MCAYNGIHGETSQLRACVSRARIQTHAQDLEAGVACFFHEDVSEFSSQTQKHFTSMKKESKFTSGFERLVFRMAFSRGDGVPATREPWACSLCRAVASSTQRFPLGSTFHASAQSPSKPRHDRRCFCCEFSLRVPHTGSPGITPDLHFSVATATTVPLLRSCRSRSLLWSSLSR